MAFNALSGMMGKAAAALVAAVVIGALSAPFVSAQDIEIVPKGDRRAGKNWNVGERYIPTIWIDPDGCEHWVMDDGAEGFMSNHLKRDGRPVCRTSNLCATMSADQYFSTNSYRLSPGGKASLQEFFQRKQARAYIIAGHTDSRASDEYNMRLSYNRANAVASVAAASGARILDVRGYGERMPKAANNTAAGMAQNRRVEIICVN